MFSTFSLHKFAVLALASSSLAKPTSPASKSSYISTISSPGCGTLKLTTTGSIIRAEIDSPTINLSHDFSVIDSLAGQTKNQSNSSTPVKAVIISSASPDFWISHYDIHTLSVNDPVKPPGNASTIGDEIARSVAALANLPVISIAEINGQVTDAGDELIGRARALEYMLSARPMDAVTAAIIGWVSRAFGSAAKLKGEVDALAERIAGFPTQALAAIKERVNAQNPSVEDVQGDNDSFVELAATETVNKAAGRFLKLGEEQTDTRFERDIPDNITEIVG
ncbi:MAG: hypothetical protein Q9170_004819 [Blastenia crenularia]